MAIDGNHHSDERRGGTGRPLPRRVPAEAAPHCTPGRHAREIVLRLRMRTLVTLGVLATATTLMGRAFGWRSPLFMGSEVALLLAILLISRYVLPLVDRHDRGACGEEHVGGLLERLPPGWRVLHDVSLSRGNVDHIAIGPPGVFAVETKSHPGPIKVERLHGALLRQARAQQALLERELKIEVQSLIVFSRAWVDRPLVRRKGVRVLPASMLLRYLKGRPATLQAARIDELRRQILDAAADAERVRQLRECDGRPRQPAGTRSSFLPRARNRIPHP